jgi:hypothetical protein
MIPSSACPPWQAEAFRPAGKFAVTCRQLHHARGHDRGPPRVGLASKRSGTPRGKPAIIHTNYLQADDLKGYLSASTGNKVVVTPFVELEMLKGDAPVNVVKSTEILAERSKQVVLTKDPMSVARLKGRRKGMKKRLIGGGRTSAFRKWSRHTRERARCGDERSLRCIARGAAGARAQLADNAERCADLC